MSTKQHLHENDGRESGRRQGRFTDIHTLRGRLLKRALIVLAILSIPMTAVSTARIIENGWQNIHILHFAMVAAVLGGVLVRRIIPLSVLTFLFLAAFLVLGIAGLLTYGLAGMGILMLAAFAVLTTILLGTAWGVSAVCICLAVIAGAGAAICTGALELPIDAAAYVSSATSWITALAAFALFATLAVFGIGRLLENLQNSLENAHASAEDARAANRRLRDEVSQRSQAEEGLHQSQVRLASIIRAAPTGIGLVSNRILLDVNEQICKMTGYSREELVGQSARMLYPDDEHFEQVGREKYAQIGKTGTGTVETVWQRKDGAAIDVLLSSTALDAEDLSQGVSFTALDITARKKAEQALIESEEKFRLAVQAVGDGLWDWDVPSGRVYYSPTWMAMLGETDLPGIYETWESRLHPNEKKRVLSSLREHLEGRTDSWSLDHRLKMSDGSWKWVLARGEVVDRGCKGEPLRMIGTMKDISDRKDAEAELQYRLGFESLLASISTHFVNIDPHEVDDSIGEALRRIGEFTQTDRSYVFLYKDDERLMDNTHEWCREGIEPCMVRMQNVPADFLYNSREFLNKGRIFCLEQMSDLPPEAEADREEFEFQGIKSLICVPMTCGDMKIGFVGFDSVRKQRNWSEDTRNLLKTVAEVFANAIARKRIQNQLQAERDFSENLIETANTLTIVLQPDGTIAKFNKYAEELTGYSKEEVLGRNWFELFVPADQQEGVSGVLEQIIESIPAAAAHENRITTKDGDVRLISWSNSAVRDNTGGVIGAISVGVDITERRRAEKEARRTTELLRLSIDNMLEGYALHEAILDENGHMVDSMYVEFNPAAERMVGRPASEIVGKTALEAFPHIAERGLLDKFARVVATGEPVYIEEFYYAGDNLDKAFDLSCFRVNRTYFVCIFRDVTERIRAAKALRENEKKYRLLVESAAQPIYTVTREGVFEFMNSESARILGQGDPAELIGKSISDYMDARAAKEQMNEIHLAVDSGQMRVAEHESVVRGEKRWFYSRIQPLTDSTGRYARALVILTDITESKMADKQIREHRAELAHVWRVNTIGEMASGLAHELNQPLCAILTYADATLRLMNLEQTPTEKVTQAIEKIANQADRAGEIIRRIRALAGKREPKKALVSINEIINEVLEMAKTDLLHEQVDLQTDLDEKLAPIHADRIEIEEVVLNLVRNAIDAMNETPPEQRTLTVRSGCESDGRTKVSVSDTGKGLPETPDTVFDAFFTTKTTGLGIGLPLSRTIIEAHGGRLWAESNESGGATFSFTVPPPLDASSKHSVGN